MKLLLQRSFLLCCVVLLSSCGLSDADKNEKLDRSELHPIRLNGKWGYIRTNGSLAIAPQFDEARFTQNGFGTYRLATSWGVIREETETIVADASFAQIGSFESELAPARISGENYGFIDATGNFVIDKQFTFAESFSEGRAAVLKDGLWGYVNQTGQTAIPFSFSAAGRFSEGLAAVQTAEGWRYIDTEGSIKISPIIRIAFAGKFSSKLAPIETTEGWGFINDRGALVIPIQFKEAYSFSEELARVKIGDFYGFIATDGEIIIKPELSEAKDFSEGFAAVRFGNAWFYLSKKTGVIAFTTPDRLTGADDFKNGLARVRIGNDENARFGYINTNGEYVWYPTN